MKVTSIPKNNYDVSCDKNNLSMPRSYINNTPGKDSVSFGSAKSGVANLFTNLSKGGFLVEFLVVDFVSLILPRILIGLNRDRDKTGKINYKAGAEEAGRELTSGPSMNLIPLGILWMFNKYAPAAHMEHDTLDVMTHNMKNMVNKASDTKDFADHVKMNKAFADELFDSAFANFKLDNKESLKSDFSKYLVDSTNVKPRIMFDSKAYKAKEALFVEHVSKINNLNQAETTLNSHSLTLKSAEKTKTIGASDLFKDFHNYSKDVLAKFSNGNFVGDVAQKAKESAVEMLEQAQKKRSRLKIANAIFAFFAVGSFLLYLPKLYQQGKVSPAMESAKRAQAEAAQGGADENK